MFKKLLVLFLVCGCGATDNVPRHRGSVVTDSGVVSEDDAGVELEFYDAGFVESCGTSDRQYDKDSRNLAYPTPPGWEQTCFFPVKATYFGRYIDEQFDPFEITLDTDDPVDYYNLSPYEVGELAYWMTAVHATMDLPCRYPTRTPYEWLSKGHFVVTGDNEVFDHLFNDPKRSGDNYEAFITASRWKCYAYPEDAYWTSVVRRRSWTRNNVITVVHEMTHMMSLAVNGHSDPEHLDERLWYGAGGEESLMGIVMNIHDCTYFPASLPCLPELP